MRALEDYKEIGGEEAEDGDSQAQLDPPHPHPHSIGSCSLPGSVFPPDTWRV